MKQPRKGVRRLRRTMVAAAGAVLLPVVVGVVAFTASSPQANPPSPAAVVSTTSPTTEAPAVVAAPGQTDSPPPPVSTSTTTPMPTSEVMATTTDVATTTATTSIPPTTVTSTTEAPLRAEPVVRIAVMGDVGTGDDKQWATAEAAAKAGAADPFDALVLLGDNVYPNGDPDRLGATVFDPFAPLLDDGAALLPVLGNHDVQDGHGDAQVARLGMPGRWYATRVGPALVVSLDSTRVEDEAQLAWLETTLAASSSDFIIVTMHHPAYSAGHHGSTGKIQRHWVPLFEAHDVDLALAGHDHDYQRSHPIDGIVYVVSGGAAKLRPTGTADFTAYSTSVLHFVALDVYRDRIELTAIGHNGVFDQAVVASR